MSEPASRRGPKIVTGALLIVAGLVAASVMWIASGERRSSAVEDLARAPVGCDTTLDFVEPGSYLVYLETSGELVEVRGDCAAQGGYDLGSIVPDAEITVVDPDGTILDLGTDVGDVSYDESGFVGTAAFSLEIAEADDHVIRVESPGDELFVVAIGGDPSEGVVELRIGAIAVGVLGVLLGVVLLVLGARRTRDDVVAPQWSSATPMGRSEPFTPGQAPSGPPTYGSARGQGPAGPPRQPAEPSGWEEPSPSFGDPNAPSPVPPPPPPPASSPARSQPGRPAAPSGPPQIPGEPDWAPSSAPPPAPPPPPPPAAVPPPPPGVQRDDERWASPETGGSQPPPDGSAAPPPSA